MSLSKKDIVEPTSIDDLWKVKYQNSQDLQPSHVISNIVLDYACCSCEHTIRSNMCKHKIAILFYYISNCSLKILLKLYGTF